MRTEVKTADVIHAHGLGVLGVESPIQTTLRFHEIRDFRQRAEIQDLQVQISALNVVARMRDRRISNLWLAIVFLVLFVAYLVIQK